MEKLLQQTADIFSGYTFRQKLQHDPNGDTHVIQFRDAEHFTRINPDTPVKIEGNKLPEKQFLTQNDVLFLAKSQYNYAIPYRGEFTRAIASSSFVVLRVTDPDVLPGYLAWYLNQSPAQHYLKRVTAGTYIHNISKKDLEELSLPIPSQEKQQRIIEISRLHQEEKDLVYRLQQRKDQLIEKQLLESIHQ